MGLIGGPTSTLTPSLNDGESSALGLVGLVKLVEEGCRPRGKGEGGTR